MSPVSALPAHSARPVAAGVAPVAGHANREARFAWAIASIGHLVPRAPWSGRVASVFARACNVACGDLLLTVGTRAVGNAPTTLVLERDAGDLRDRFAVGERVAGSGEVIRGARVELDLANASVWRPDARGARVADAQIEARLDRVRRRLSQRRAAWPNVLDREGAGVAAALAAACVALDVAEATAQIDRLVGWGEGLTPAGDDFLVGLLAGLDALLAGDAERRRFRDGLAAAVVARTNATTVISAHELRLAAAGHCGESLDRCVAALCCAGDDRAGDAALERLLAVGATSGADTASGVVAALHAWSRAPCFAEAA